MTDAAARKAEQARSDGNAALAKFYEFCAPSQCKSCGGTGGDCMLFACGRCQGCHVMECTPGKGDHAP